MVTSGVKTATYQRKRWRGTLWYCGERFTTFILNQMVQGWRYPERRNHLWGYGRQLAGRRRSRGRSSAAIGRTLEENDEIVKGVVKGENEAGSDSVQQTGADITSALTSKAASVRKEKESTTATKETYTTEKWGKEGGTTIHQISFSVDINKIKDLPLLYKLIDELKDAQNRTDNPEQVAT